MSTTATQLKSEPQVPLWQNDEPTHYFAAFNYHKPWVTSPPYLQSLSGADETAFEDWVDTYDVPVDITATTVGYDYRGYWLARIKGTATGWSIVERLPDIWLTPYSTQFSSRSKYARNGCPYNWSGDKLFDESNGLLMFWANYAPPKDTAVNALEKSKIDPTAQAKGLMGEDLDMESFRLYIFNRLRLKADDQVLDATVTRSIEGASTIDIQLDDNDRSILRSGLLSKGLDFKLDGMWWELAKVSKDERDQLTLTFETREIARLRKRVKFIMQQRDNEHTRAQFILRMIRELRDNPDYINVPVVIPQLKIIQRVAGQPINPDGTATQSPDDTGIPDNQPLLPNEQLPLDPRRNLIVKTERARADQIDNVNKILAAGMALNANRKCLVCSIMVATQENSITNNDFTEPHVGLFQQDPGWGTFEQRMDPTHAANAFFRDCIVKDRNNPSQSYADLCESVQHSGNHGTDYAPWKGQAENWVNAYLLSTGQQIVTTAIDPLVKAGLLPPTLLPPSVSGVSPNNNTRVSVGSAASDPTIFYYRGIPGSGANDWGAEDSWTCILNLAREVNWRAFFVGGTFWYINDTDLFVMKPIMTIDESSAGIDSISFDYDNNKKNATVTLKVRVGRWVAQPGAVVVIQNEGPINGKWLVNEFSRSLFDLTATVILKKPLPELPEPLTPNPGATPVRPPVDTSPAPGTGGTIPLTPVKGTVVIPVNHQAVNHQADAGQTAGLPGYYAVDFICDADGNTVPGASVTAMGQSVMFQESGVARRIEHKDWVPGFGGVTFYFLGDSGHDYFITHLDESSPIQAGRVEAGQVIGYLTKSIVNSGLINGAHVHVGCTGYTPPG